jgi:hypothetical protein
VAENNDGGFRIYEGVFQGLSEHRGKKVIQVDDGRITPLDRTTELLFTTVLRGDLPSYLPPPRELDAETALLSSKQEFPASDPSYLIVSEPEKNWNGKAESTRWKPRKELADQHGIGKLWIQVQKGMRPQPPSNFSVEELPTLLSMLHFRSKGYAVQPPLPGLEGSGFVAWRSPFLDKLRTHRMIEYGCYIDQLRYLRELWPLDSVAEAVTQNELIYTSISSGENKAFSEGINQLIGNQWTVHPSSLFPEGAVSQHCFSKLYVAFTFDEYDLTSWKKLPRLNEEMRRDISKGGIGNKTGMLVWTPDRLAEKIADVLPAERMGEAISAYERYAKLLILSNFTLVREIKWLMNEFQVDASRMTLGEAVNGLGAAALAADDELFLSKIDLLLSNGPQ